MKKMLKISLLIAGILLCFGFLGCGDDEEENTVVYDSDFPFKGTWRGTAYFEGEPSPVTAVFTENTWNYKCPNESKIVANVSGTYEALDIGQGKYSAVLVISNALNGGEELPFGVAMVDINTNNNWTMTINVVIYGNEDNHSELKKVK